MAGDLTVSERILYHLNSYLKFEDKYEAPFDITQDGISQACSISRAHAAIELKKLKGANIVDERLAHVRRGKSRRKVYFLTTLGKTKASEVAQYVRDNAIAPKVDPAKVSPELTPAKIKATRRSSPVPVVKEFFGREGELGALARALADPATKVLSVRGIPGIGKTTLIARFVSGLSGQRIFWYTAKPWDATKSLADSLGKFFYENGARKLSAYLSSGKFELGELSFLLNEELAENGYTLVFDDSDASAQLQDFLRMLRHSSGLAKIVVTSESRPSFYDGSDIVARKEVVEIELGGLDKKSAVRLLHSRGIEGSVADELVRVAHGHPLSLEMVTDSSPKEARYQVSKFFEDRFYSALAEPEKSLLQLSSVFQKPFASDAIPKELKGARKGSMLREVAPGNFEIHASLRDFVYNSMTSDEKAKWHSSAADYYLRTGESQERLFHLVKARRTLEAEIMMSKMADASASDGNIQRLWDSMRDFEPTKPKYRAAALLAKARVATMVGRYEVAWSLLEKVSSDEKGKSTAEALVEMGNIKSRQGQLDEAFKLFDEALGQSAELPATRARALRGQGVLQGKRGDFAKAQELLERSALDAMAAMDVKGMLMAHMELGNVFMGRSMHEQAIAHFSKCAAGFGPVDLTGVHMNMGIACDALGRSGDARLHLENAVRLADETGQPRSKELALIALAEVLTKSGHPEDAREHCFRALEIATELSDMLGVSSSYAGLGKAEAALGNRDAVKDYCSESLAALRGMEDPKILENRKNELALLLP